MPMKTDFYTYICISSLFTGMYKNKLFLLIKCMIHSARIHYGKMY